MVENNLEDLKNKIKLSPILSAREKQEWFYLLPKMTAEQVQELDRILSIKLPSQPVNPVTTPTSRREWHSGPLRSGSNGAGNGVKTEEPKEARTEEPPKKEPVVFEAKSALEKICLADVSALRQTHSVYAYLESLGKRMKELIVNREADFGQVMAAFEQSALYKAYLDAGLKIMDGQEPESLTRPEFEALADFRASLRKILNLKT